MFTKTPLQQQIELRFERDLGEMLRELYVAKRHSDQEIADYLSVTRAAVQQWRVQFGISRHDRPPVAA